MRPERVTRVGSAALAGGLRIGLSERPALASLTSSQPDRPGPRAIWAVASGRSAAPVSLEPGIAARTSAPPPPLRPAHLTLLERYYAENRIASTAAVAGSSSAFISDSSLRLKSSISARLPLSRAKFFISSGSLCRS